VEVPGGTIRVSKQNKPQRRRRRRILTNVQNGEQKECMVQSTEIEAPGSWLRNYSGIPSMTRSWPNCSSRGWMFIGINRCALLRRLREVKQRPGLTSNTGEELVKAQQLLYWL